MTIAESFKIAINDTFLHTVFQSRDAKTIFETITKNVHGSNNMRVIPPIPKIEVENIDQTHDKLTLCFDDVKVEGIVTWKVATAPFNGRFVFIKYE